MRLLAVALFACATSSFVSAADTDEDKAKEAAVQFLKALKAKDLETVMKSVDVPFLLEDRTEPVAKLEELKDLMTPRVEKLKPEKIPGDVGRVLDNAALRKFLEEKGKKKAIESVDKVLGKTGYAVFFVQDGKERGAVLVQIKDGKAKVVGLPD